MQLVEHNSDQGGAKYNRFRKPVKLVYDQLATQATKAVKVSLTLRNWMIGLYIAEFELRGADRANYGDQLFSALAKQLTSLKVSSSNRRRGSGSGARLILAHSFFHRLFTIHGRVEDTGDLYHVPLFNVIRNVMCNWKRP
jgi:hypothetical protein